jgi:thiol-disulfide isomerase/thioredoxin
MVQGTRSVVTPERYAQGMTYDEYIASIERNQARFQENYDEMSVDPEHVAALKELMAKPGGPAKILLLGEDWCPDVFRGAPVFARLAEATGMELRMFPRDANKDIMAEFLAGGEFESIPVAVFYTMDLDYIAHWIERPVLANEQMRTDLRDMYVRLRKPDKTDEEREAAKRETIAFQHGPMWSNWRQETVREVIDLLRDRLR